MITYRPGDVLLVDFPFVQGGGGKLRPALVVADTGDNDVILARITTQRYGATFDMPLINWHAAGLIAPSVVRLHKLATINKTLIQRKLGGLTDVDQHVIAAQLPHLWDAWNT